MAIGDWAEGWGRIADLGSGDWKAPDLQNVFLRMAGTDADTANPRTVGSYQGDAIRNIKGRSNYWSGGAPGSASNTGPFFNDPAGSYKSDATVNSAGGSLAFDASLTVPVGGDNRPQSAAVAPVVVV